MSNKSCFLKELQTTTRESKQKLESRKKENKKEAISELRNILRMQATQGKTGISIYKITDELRRRKKKFLTRVEIIHEINKVLGIPIKNYGEMSIGYVCWEEAPTETTEEHTSTE
jgi:hypothetical protein